MRKSGLCYGLVELKNHAIVYIRLMLVMIIILHTKYTDAKYYAMSYLGAILWNFNNKFIVNDKWNPFLFFKLWNGMQRNLED